MAILVLLVKQVASNTRIAKFQLDRFNLGVLFLWQLALFASGHASQCANEANLTDTSGVNINVNFGNSTAEDTNKQITQVYNINPSKKEEGCKGDVKF